MQAAIMKILWNGVNVHKAHNKIKQQQQQQVGKGIKTERTMAAIALTFLVCLGRTTCPKRALYAIENTAFLLYTLQNDNIHTAR